MTLRDSAGSQWIYSDEEPIAQLNLETAELLQMKLAPNRPPQLKAGLTWLESKQTKPFPATLKSVLRSKDGKEITLVLTGNTAIPKANTENTLRVRFDPRMKSFAYEFEGRALLDASQDLRQFKSVEFNYLFPLVASNSTAEYTWEIFYGTDGTLYRSPIRNDWDDNPRERSLRPYYYGSIPNVSQKRGHVLIRGPHSDLNPAVEFLETPKSFTSSCATCAFSHETHLGQALTKERAYHSHYRFVGYSPTRWEKLFSKAEIRTNTKPKESTRVALVPGINSFGKSQQVLPAEPLFANSVRGTYQVNEEMLLFSNADWARFVNTGGRKWNHVRFKALFEKKNENEKLILHGPNTVIIEPPNRKWFTVERNVSSNTFEIYYEGEGRVWIDDVDFSEGFPNLLYLLGLSR